LSSGILSVQDAELVQCTLRSAEVCGQLVAADLFVSLHVSCPLFCLRLPGFCLTLLHTGQNFRVCVHQLLRLLIGQVQIAGNRLEVLQRFGIQLNAFASLNSYFSGAPSCFCSLSSGFSAGLSPSAGLSS
jgi:hypothetical protein